MGNLIGNKESDERVDNGSQCGLQVAGKSKHPHSVAFPSYPTLTLTFSLIQVFQEVRKIRAAERQRRKAVAAEREQSVSKEGTPV